MNNLSLKDLNTKLAVVDYHNEGRKISEIVRLTGIPSQTLSDFLLKKSHGKFWEWYDTMEEEGGVCCGLPPANYSLTKNGKPSEKTSETFNSSPFEELYKTWKDPALHYDPEDVAFKTDNSRILLISDLHIPYHHPDSLAFLQHLKDKYNPTRVICLGDELDKHALSFHDSDPNLPSAGDELKMSLPVIAKLKEMFPIMDILESNHGSLLYRKAHHHGIPKEYLKTYNEVLKVDDGWQWYYDLVVDLPDGNKCYIHHGKSANVTKTSQTMSMCAVQGHFHETFKVEYWGNPVSLYWAMQCGCLIDDSSYAFNYNNVNLKRPIIGTGLIIDSQPILEPMILNKYGRWIQE